MTMRRKLALLVLLCGVLSIAACGDDNDTPIATPTPVDTATPRDTNTPVNTSPPTQVPPTATEGTPGSTSTPTPTLGGAPPTADTGFTCKFKTSFTCVGGARDTQVCRPARPTPQPEDLCPGGQCMETEFFCKGGPMDDAPCLPPNARTPVAMRTPLPCTAEGKCQNSELEICTQQVCPIVSRRLGGGGIDVACNSTTGQCNALLNADDLFDPVDIPGIGFVCIRKVDPSELTCPAGRVDCDGGTGLDYDLRQVHTIGACGVPNDPNDTSGNPQCREMCDAYCTRKGGVMIDATCAGYCKGGGDPPDSKRDQYCQCDSMSAACTGPNCAPEGSCNGKDLRDADVGNPAALRDRNVCGCQCLTEGGPASRAGAINFQVGSQIIVETAPPCGSGAVLLTLAPQCIPLTTETSSGVLTNANNSPTCNDGDPGPGCAQIPMQGSLVRRGSPLPCDTLFGGGSLEGLNVVGNISFFDSTIGDIETQLDWFCE